MKRTNHKKKMEEKYYFFLLFSVKSKNLCEKTPKPSDGRCTPHFDPFRGNCFRFQWSKNKAKKN
jgi:hypothetical protein